MRCRGIFLGMLAILGVCLFGPYAMAEESAGQPSPQELQEYEQEIQKYLAELQKEIGKSTHPSEQYRTMTPVPKRKQFSVTKKSSSITRALRRAKDALNAEVNAWMNELSSQGYIPVDKPEPVQDFKYKWGISGLKFYVRLKLDLTIYCVKP